MNPSHRASARRLTAACALALTAALAATTALAADAARAPSPAAAAPVVALAPSTGTATTAAPTGFVAPAEPRADDTNAERGKTQPGNNAPMWRAVRDTGTTEGVTTLPGAEKGVLIQPFVQYPGARWASAGEAWRQVRNDWILPYGGALLAIMATAIAIFFWRRGPLGGHERNTGRLVERFTPFERACHGINAAAFVVLAVSGLVMAFGKWVLLPVMGSTLFGWLAFAMKNAHNFAGPLFVVSQLFVIAIFARDNLPKAHDLTWLRHAGGLFGGKEVPSHRFNAGEKGMFWVGVFALGLVVMVTGVILDQIVPGVTWLRGDMQVAHMLHAVAAIGMMAIIGGHIYMGTIGMKGAYASMRTGYVDEAWAREHHELWYDDVKAGRIPAQRSGPRDGTAGGAVTAAR